MESFRNSNIEVITMPEQKNIRKFYPLILAAALLVAVLSGCSSAGVFPSETLPSGSFLPESPAISSKPSESPSLAPSENPSTTPAPAADSSGPAITSSSAPSTLPEPSPSVIPIPDPVSTPEPTPTPAPEPVPNTSPIPENLVADTTPVEAVLEDEAVALSSAEAAVPHPVSAVASGILEKKNPHAVIDYSNTADGYVMVQYTSQTALRLKVQVKGPSTTYTYNLTPLKWAVFPLSDGNGTYQITVYQNVTGSKYAAVLSLNTQAALKDEFSPFLHSNQYVDYDNAPKTVSMADKLIGDTTDPLKKVETVYDYVVKGMTYDKQLAASVKSGYLPVLDSVLEKKTGICFDYAALMTGMLRSQGVPCKLVVGYAGTAYHAWISVWVEGSGWVDGVIWFDGTQWQRMDPTFASSGNSSQSILAYIGDGTNYTSKYFY